MSDYGHLMRSLTVTEVKARLNELVDEAESTHEQIMITKHGRPAAVIVAAEDLESLQETVYWLSQPGIRESIAEAEANIAAGHTIGSEQLRQQLGLPPR
jgi:antitoxin YefM